MKYTSTRSNTIQSTFEEAICQGYSPDGGLYVPCTLPYNFITIEKLMEWKSCTYKELLFIILRIFISPTEISDIDLQFICTKSITGFDDNESNIIPVIPLVEKNCNSDIAEETSTTKNNRVYIGELFHGPTYCFKDFGMRVLINLLSYFASCRQRSITLIVSTTGDTGPAAVQAVADCANPLLSILVHYPTGQISNFQRKQLTTINSNSNSGASDDNDNDETTTTEPSTKTTKNNTSCNIHIVSFDGGGDDMDAPIKRMILENQQSQQKWIEDNKKNVHETEKIASPHTPPPPPLWTGVNSYNIGRPLTQMVHFIWIYLRIIEQEEKRNLNDNNDTSNNNVTMGTEIDFIIPTGAMGNVVGGYMAKCMGLPIHKFITCVNCNDIVHRAIQYGQYSKNPIMYKTLSDAINIQIPYNFERLLYYLYNENCIIINKWMIELETTNEINFTNEWIIKCQTIFNSYRVTDTAMISTIQQCYKQYNYLVDPHTAIALCGAYELGYLSKSLLLSVVEEKQQQQQSSIDDNNDNTTTNSRSSTSISSIAAVVATASPCKFEESMTVAIGQEKWNEYITNSTLYPARAKELLLKEEVEPTQYHAIINESLEVSQKQWEHLSRSIIANQFQS